MNWKFWTQKKPIKVVQVPVPDEKELLLYKLYAATYEKSVEEWLADHARNSIPQEFRSKFELAQSRNKTLGTSIEGFMGQLDYVDRLTKLGNKTVKPKLKEADPEVFLKLGVHPCRYFDNLTPVHLSQRECQGSCHHPTRNWQPCGWEASSAENCALYNIKPKGTT